MSQYALFAKLEKQYKRYQKYCKYTSKYDRCDYPQFMTGKDLINKIEKFYGKEDIITDDIYAQTMVLNAKLTQGQKLTDQEMAWLLDIDAQIYDAHMNQHRKEYYNVS